MSSVHVANDTFDGGKWLEFARRGETYTPTTIPYSFWTSNERTYTLCAVFIHRILVHFVRDSKFASFLANFSLKTPLFCLENQLSSTLLCKFSLFFCLFIDTFLHFSLFRGCNKCNGILFILSFTQKPAFESLNLCRFTQLFGTRIIKWRQFSVVYHFWRQFFTHKKHGKCVFKFCSFLIQNPK